jgi:hypothetical protein
LRPRKRGFVNSSLSSPPTSEVCAEIKKFGYTVSQRIRIYGEEFEVLSDPFPSEGGVAIKVRSRSSLEGRVRQLPATVIHWVTRGFPHAA